MAAGDYRKSALHLDGCLPFAGASGSCLRIGLMLLAVDDVFHCPGEAVEVVDGTFAAALGSPVLAFGITWQFLSLVLLEPARAPGF